MDKREAINHIKGLVDAVNNEYAVSQEDVTENWAITEEALRVLGADEHPGEVPGLATAITRSQWDAATKIADQFVVCDIANAWGLCIIPDPEPTNAEKLAQLHDQYTRLPVQHLPGNRSFADYLDHKGVKAPTDD